MLSACLLALFCFCLPGKLMAEDLHGYVANQTEYAHKLDEYHQLEKNGRQNPDLYNNMGICYYHLNQKGHAILSFLRALNLDSSHHDAMQNLLYVQSQTSDASLYPKRSILVQKIFDFYNFLNLKRLAYLVLLTFLLLGISLHLLWHRKNLQEKGYHLLFILICTSLLIFASTLLITKFQRHNHNRKAVVISFSTSGFLNINEQGSPRFRVSEGLIVEIEREMADWSYIRLPNGLGGWVEKANLGKVVP